MNRGEVQIILAAHGSLGQALKESCRYFTGELEDIKVFSLQEEDEVRVWEEELLSYVDGCAQVLIMTDMLKASTTVHASLALHGANVELVTGVNLVMLVQAVQLAAVCDVHELARRLADMGKEDIVYLRDMMTE